MIGLQYQRSARVSYRPTLLNKNVDVIMLSITAIALEVPWSTATGQRMRLRHTTTCLLPIWRHQFIFLVYKRIIRIWSRNIQGCTRNPHGNLPSTVTLYGEHIGTPYAHVLGLHVKNQRLGMVQCCLTAFLATSYRQTDVILLQILLWQSEACSFQDLLEVRDSLYQ